MPVIVVEKEEEVVPVAEPVLLVDTKEDKKEDVAEKVVEVQAPQSDVFYRVQLAAGKRNVKVTYFKNKYKFRNEIFLENHEGWYKYIIGYFTSYDEAAKVKNSCGTSDAWVITEKDGMRINIRRALNMLSHYYIVKMVLADAS